MTDEQKSPDDDPLRNFHQDRFVEYPSATRVLSEFSYVYRLAGNNNRPQQLIFTANPGMGKSALVDTFLERYQIRKSTRSAGRINIINIEFGNGVSPKILLSDISKAFGMSGNAAMTKHDFASLAKRTGLELIIIDEFHNLLFSQKQSLQNSLNLIKWIGNTVKIPFILVGTKEILRVIEYDLQFASRFRGVELVEWKSGRELQNFILSYLSTFPVSLPDEISSSIFPVILKGSLGCTRDIVRILSQSVFEAHTNNELEKLEDYIVKVSNRKGYLS